MKERSTARSSDFAAVAVDGAANYGEVHIYAIGLVNGIEITVTTPIAIWTIDILFRAKAGLTKPLPVCDYAGLAPFGFEYRRCPGEQLTIEVLRFSAQGVARQDRLPKAQPAQSAKGPSRTWRGDR